MFPEELLKASRAASSGGNSSGNSATTKKGKRGGGGKSSTSSSTSVLFPEFEILNTDICVSIMQLLRATFAGAPGREYAVGDVCKMVDPTTPHLPRTSTADCFASSTSSSSWWRGVDVGTETESSFISPNSVDLIFDKGTIDALMSGFASGRGDGSNPNVMAYINESLKVLRKPISGGSSSGGGESEGGRIVLLSINAKEVIEPYFYLAGTEFSSSDSDDDETDGKDLQAKVKQSADTSAEANDGPTFGFQLVHFDRITYDRKQALEHEMGENDGDEAAGAAENSNKERSGGTNQDAHKKLANKPKQDWIHSYGTTYTVFVFKVVKEK